jgi:hypothetical protein
MKTHCKKRLASFPSPGGMSLTKLSVVGNNLIIPNQRESLVSEIPAGDRKLANLFLQCRGSVKQIREEESTEMKILGHLYNKRLESFAPCYSQFLPLRKPYFTLVLIIHGKKIHETTKLESIHEKYFV